MGKIRNIIGGAATVLDISPRPSSRKFRDKNAPRSVAEALSRDWTIVGQSLQDAMNTAAGTLSACGKPH